MSPRSVSVFLDAIEDHTHRPSQVTWPIVHAKNPEVDFIGTSVLLRTSAASLLIAAAHVADHASSSRLYIAGGDGLFPLPKPALVTKKPRHGRSFDRLDLAVFVLPDAASNALPPTSMLSLNEVEQSAVDDHDRFYLALGYPRTKQATRIRRGTLGAYLHRFATTPLSQDIHDRLGVDRRRSILVGFDRKKMWRSESQRVISPDLNGLSGGGLWWIGNQGGQACLAGIIIERLPDGQQGVLATRSSFLLDALRVLAPALVPELSM